MPGFLSQRTPAPGYLDLLCGNLFTAVSRNLVATLSGNRSIRTDVAETLSALTDFGSDLLGIDLAGFNSVSKIIQLLRDLFNTGVKISESVVDSGQSNLQPVAKVQQLPNLPKDVNLPSLVTTPHAVAQGRP
ncbi:MAG: hypothetical protein EKK42_20335 [Pseudonocardiaceae bacterium]|nr:MAG: hypothetical protein EKK42_20335 [Pseudonocardiaceae bacterium]